MALPAAIIPTERPPIGIDWRVNIASTLYYTRIQRAPDVSGSPGTYIDIALLRPGETFFRDALILNASTYWYRCRHEGRTVTASAWTTGFCGVATLLDDVEFPKALSIPAAATIQDTGTINVVDETGTASSITKTIRIPWGQFVPNSELITWLFSGVYLRPGDLNSQGFSASVVFPKGVTIIAFRIRGWRQNAATVCNALLVRVDDNGSTTTLANLSPAATAAYNTVSATGLSQLVGDEAYVIRLSLDSDTAVDDARFLWAEADYTMPSYDKGY